MTDHARILPVELGATFTDSELPEATIRLQIPEDLRFLEGHFPGHPILPGAVQLQWAITYGKKLLNRSNSAVKQVEVLKFQNIIRPGDIVVLTLTTKTSDKFIFSFESKQGKHASGRVILSDN
ncbi:hypothetical protein OLMES_1030 [Oleiphilus messinensis]|uniref:ApeI dehydratase-like domain-containing protein n=1 Tax=Oleiphilus messinensis TaxID=141451 RepID=A0A1Y0I5P4_9GAMM|nr:hypothetical protein [Oleiphilus messinensis]ARU55116.1 hypothetical protein OLMES_1030 [Oleiphilus messinensis]